jgi:hypothetical protein
MIPAVESVAAPTWVEVRAPYTGIWNKLNAAPPAIHDPGAWGGDWSTDFYAPPPTSGNWYAYSSSGSSVTAQVAQVGNTCGAASWTYAGYKYKIEVTNDSGALGWWEYAHVDPDGGYYFIVNGSYVPNGMHIGKTHLWQYRYKCYEVRDNDGTHWHVVGYNLSAYSCYPPAPPNNPGATLYQQSGLLGVVGSNATGPGMSCW